MSTTNNNSCHGLLVTECPQPEIRKACKKASNKKEEKESLFCDGSSFHSMCVSWIKHITQEDELCLDMSNRSRESVCDCLALDVGNLLTQAVSERLASWLVKHATMSAEDQHERVFDWIRCAGYNAHENNKKVFVLPSCTTKHVICRNALCRLLGIEKCKWGNLLKDSEEMRPHNHGLKGNHNATNSATVHMLHKFFRQLETLALPRATQLVRSVVTRKDGQTVAVKTLRGTDIEIVELPTCMTKRSLFKRLLLENGHTMKFDNNGRIAQPATAIVAPAEGEEMHRLHLPGFTTFRAFWKDHCNHVVVPRPREDICNACFQFANAFRHRKRIREQAGCDSEDSDESNNSFSSESFEATEAAEDAVTAAALHVEMARKQRELTNEKRQAALDDRNLAINERRLCCVGDYAQNGCTPSLCGEQPGDTHCFSPLNAHTFGLVDCSLEPKKLFAC